MPDTITRFFSQPAAPVTRHRAFHPWRRAILMAGLYLVVCVLYIVISGFVVEGLAETTDQLRQFEMVKGIAFVGLTSLFLLFFAWQQFRQLASRELEVARHSEALLNSERRALTAIFAASLAHDINNVLVLCDYGFEELGKGEDLTDSQHELLDDMTNAKNSLKCLVKRLMNVSKQGIPGEVSSVAIDEIIEDVAALTQVHCAMLGCYLNVGDVKGIRMEGNAALIHQMLVNLIINAADAAGRGGKVRLDIELTDTTVSFEVHDSGPGIPLDQRSVIFDTFYTTKPDGTGLGLLSVKACTAAHHGTVDILDSSLGGACFRVCLPVTPP